MTAQTDWDSGYTLTLQIRQLCLSPLDSCFSRSRIRLLSESNVVSPETLNICTPHTHTQRRGVRGTEEDDARELIRNQRQMK